MEAVELPELECHLPAGLPAQAGKNSALSACVHAQAGYLEAVSEEFVRQAVGAMAYDLLQKQIRAPVWRALRIIRRIQRIG